MECLVCSVVACRVECQEGEKMLAEVMPAAAAAAGAAVGAGAVGTMGREKVTLPAR